MEINDKININSNKKTSANVKTTGSETSAKSELTAEAKNNVKPDANEKVSLTPEAKKLETIHQNMGSGAPVDMKRVAQIKQEINAGTYKINYENLAEKIANSEQAFDSPAEKND